MEYPKANVRAPRSFADEYPRTKCPDCGAEVVEAELRRTGKMMRFNTLYEMDRWNIGRTPDKRLVCYQLEHWTPHVCKTR